MEILKAEKLVKTFAISEKQRKSLGIKEKKKIAVDGISFTAKSGEVFGLIGPNGAGKTTTMRMLATLIRPDSGDALYNEVSAVKSPMEIRSKLAFLTTDLKPDMKSTPSIMFDFFADLYHVPKDEAQKRKKALFEEFGIDKFADTMIAKLSQGQRQKVSLVNSVIHDPKFVIFDEPTNGLDIIAAREVREFILNMKKAEKCVIISTHLFDLVEKVCDRAAMIMDGKIVVDDTLENLMQGRPLEDAFYDIYTEHMSNKGEK
ncbi:ABC transporter ATP-binding protein [Ruminococcus sp.]|uniref:ABC transporter ATP-binding protein n=1 Tax=Ruminococcus sp. TaxID=41978 RepID=UPI0025DD91F0|nr:ABC transporter ATP-binding protein [Ruminococcus sp.]MBO4523741.1 ABC transporter ATP-binding protein [Ruminococcus sp.]